MSEVSASDLSLIKTLIHTECLKCDKIFTNYSLYFLCSEIKKWCEQFWWWFYIPRSQTNALWYSSHHVHRPIKFRWLFFRKWTVWLWKIIPDIHVVTELSKLPILHFNITFSIIDCIIFSSIQWKYFFSWNIIM